MIEYNNHWVVKLLL